MSMINSAKPASDETTVSLPDVDPEHGLPSGFGVGLAGRVLFWTALGFSVFQLGISLYAILPAQVVRALHVGLLCLIAGGLLANHTARNGPERLFWWGAGLVGVGIAAYQWIFYTQLLLRSGDLNHLDVVLGVINLAVIFLMVWRFMGAALPIVAGVFLAYVLLGHLLPAPLNHRGYALESVIDHLAYGTEGIYGTPTGVSSTFIFLFILFGSFLERAGMIKLFTDIAMGMFGGARGGPAKVAVFSSALMGTISGSGVANVVATGQFTIPLMKRFGYNSAFAGGVEATASMGGQIMPPVMGAVAFIMAEIIGVPYATIVQAAIIPALLYFGAAFWSVHLEAGKRGLMGIPRAELPSALEAIRTRWFLLLPLCVLIWLLFSGYTPLFAGSVGLGLTAVVILGGAVALGLPSTAIRVAFWIALGLACASFQRYGVVAILSVVGLLILINACTRGGRETLLLCRDSMADGARQALPVGLACAIVGIVIGVMTLTGVATIIGNTIIGIGKDTLILALILTMVFSLILGMGIPTIPNYIITSSLAAPILIGLDVPLIISHMFVFYFGIMADLTPPVALAAFAAAPIARESAFRIGFQALRIALPGFVIPYMAVYDPALMLQPIAGVTGGAYAISVAYVVLKAVLAIGLWGAASIGYAGTALRWWERIAAAIAAGFLVVALPVTDEIGFAMAAILGGWFWWQARQLHNVAVTA
jgi:TRAP transporter 4TM/12TM fusion protein